MNKLKKSTAILTVLVLILSIFPVTSFAVDPSSEIESISTTDSINLRASVVATEETDEGVEITFNLLQETISNPSDGTYSAQGIGWIVVGYGKLRVTVYRGNGCGQFNWSFTLDNGDKIKGVTGTLVFEKDGFLTNPNYAKAKVSEYYSTGTLYATASGAETFSFPDDEPSDQKVNFKWSGFVVTGVTNNYILTDGNQKGTLEDFFV